MGEDIAISLKNVSKNFKQYARPIDRLKELLLPGKSYAKEFWALKDVSFDIIKGQTMGIIGRNGAGKSTLLQIICGTLTPTSGYARVDGRVAALLELGAGFNPEFTGRENVYINGAIMGLSRQEVDERFDKVAGFADIGDFINQPIKTYSSGMYVRLAFAAAIHVNPGILIVDEALAVGDMFFQAKCMARMKQMMDNGVTVLFVSHDIGSVKSLCSSCVFLENGSISSIGKSEFVVNEYLKTIREKVEGTIENANTDTKKELSRVLTSIKSEENVTDDFCEVKSNGYGSKDALIEKFRLLGSLCHHSDYFEWGEEITVQVIAKFLIPTKDYSIGFLIRDIYGLDIFGTNLMYEQVSLPEVETEQKLLTNFSFDLMLQPGTYTLTLAVSTTDEDNSENICDWHDNIHVFKVNKIKHTIPDTKVYIPTKTEVKIVK